jgi:hypothetical protein
MRRVKLKEGQLHRIIRHAINESVEKYGEEFTLKGIFWKIYTEPKSEFDFKEIMFQGGESWHESITAETLRDLIDKLCEKYGEEYDMDNLYFYLPVFFYLGKNTAYVFRIYKTQNLSAEEVSDYEIERVA